MRYVFVLRKVVYEIGYIHESKVQKPYSIKLVFSNSYLVVAKTFVEQVKYSVEI